MSEIETTMRELDNLHANHVDAWPNEPLRLAAEDIISRYDETGQIDEWMFETATALVNLVNSRIK